jgi:hypothetical protein
MHRMAFRRKMRNRERTLSNLLEDYSSEMMNRSRKRCEKKVLKHICISVQFKMLNQIH